MYCILTWCDRSLQLYVYLHVDVSITRSRKVRKLMMWCFQMSRLSFSMHRGVRWADAQRRVEEEEEEEEDVSMLPLYVLLGVQ